MTSSVKSSFATATEMFQEVFAQVNKERQELDKEKKEWEKEKSTIDKKFIFNGPRIALDIGGVHYSTSRSTLTKYPKSMLGIMFSGRHDLATMQCEDGSFFIDRDGTHFRHILNYLRDGKEVVESFPKSADVLLELIRETKFYQLDGLTSVLKPLLRENDVVIQDKITPLFFSDGGTYYTEYVGPLDYRGYQQNTINVSYSSRDKIRFKHKNMRGLSFNYMRFSHAVSFIDCDLTNATFQHNCFESDAIFEDCILDNTTFTFIQGLVTNSCKVSFAGSKTDKTKFDTDLRSSLKSAGKIP